MATTPAYDALTEFIFDLLDYKRDEDSVYVARKLLNIRELMIVEDLDEDGM